jgi:hypothetical protein
VFGVVFIKFAAAPESRKKAKRHHRTPAQFE